VRTAAADRVGEPGRELIAPAIDRGGRLGSVRGHGIPGYAAVVLAGGAATRMGGAAKPTRPVDGTPLLSRVLAATATAEVRIVVGPPELDPLLTDATVLRTWEQPPGGGPVAAVAAGLRLVPAGLPRVAVLAADLPFLSPDVLDRLAAGLTTGVDAAVLVDADDRPQWLCALWHRAALAERMPADPDGRSMRSLMTGAAVAPVTRLERPPAWFDCDTEDDIRRAEELARE
jgi:molybdenum cofactor guanylyltransferase